MQVLLSCERASAGTASSECCPESSYREYVDERIFRSSGARLGSHPGTAPCVGSRSYRRGHDIHRRTAANSSRLPHRLVLGAGSYDRFVDGGIVRRRSESTDVEMA